MATAATAATGASAGASQAGGVPEGVPAAKLLLPTSSSTVDEVASWILSLDIAETREIAASIRAEEVDGNALYAYRNKLELKSDLSLSGGKATRVWQAIVSLKASAQPSAAGGGVGLQPAEVLVCKATGEVLTPLEILQRGLLMGECHTVEEAAVLARSELTGALADAKIKTEGLSRGLADLEKKLEDLDASRDHIASELAEAINKEDRELNGRSAETFATRRAELEAMLVALNAQEAAVKERTTAVLSERRIELEAMLMADYKSRHDSLDAQRRAVAEHLEALQIVCEDGLSTLDASDHEVCVCFGRLQMALSNTAGAGTDDTSLSPACSSAIPFDPPTIAHHRVYHDFFRVLAQQAEFESASSFSSRDGRREFTNRIYADFFSVLAQVGRIGVDPSRELLFVTTSAHHPRSAAGDQLSPAGSPRSRLNVSTSRESISVMAQGTAMMDGLTERLARERAASASPSQRADSGSGGDAAPAVVIPGARRQERNLARSLSHLLSPSTARDSFATDDAAAVHNISEKVRFRGVGSRQGDEVAPLTAAMATGVSAARLESLSSPLGLLPPPSSPTVLPTDVDSK